LGISSIQQKAAPVETKVFGSNEVQVQMGKKKRNLQLKKQWIVFLKEKIAVEFSLAHTAHTAQLYPNPEMFSRSKNTSLAALAVDSRSAAASRQRDASARRPLHGPLASHSWPRPLLAPNHTPTPRTD
jgi:hypothetical protein